MFLCQVEESLKEMQYPKTSIFRPGLLDRGAKKRFLEKAYGRLRPFLMQETLFQASDSFCFACRILINIAIFETNLTESHTWTSKVVMWHLSVTKVSIVRDTKTLQMLSRFCHSRIELLTCTSHYNSAPQVTNTLIGVFLRWNLDQDLFH